MNVTEFDKTLLLPHFHLKEPYIIGIDGLSRSGKSTFVRELRRYFEDQGSVCFTFHIDDYIVRRNRRYETGFEEWYEYYFLQWDVEWLKDHFFNRIDRCRKVELPFYEESTDTHVLQEVNLEKVQIILVEGVFLQRKAWRHYFNRMLFLDCPKEERFARENEETRKNLRKFQNRYWAAEEYYMKHVKPIESADFVIES